MPKTVPLFLESTNDVLPGSPSFKYLQISPENERGSFNFPEVTFSNIVALKTKSFEKERRRTRADKEKTSKQVFDDEFSERFRKKLSDFSLEPEKKDRIERIVQVGAEVVDQTKAFRDSCTPNNHNCEEVLSKNDATDEASRKFSLPCSKAKKTSVVRSRTCSEICGKSFEKEKVQRGYRPERISLTEEFSESDRDASLPAQPTLANYPPSSDHRNKKAEPVVHAEPPRRHRHSLAEHQNLKHNLTYFKLYGLSVGPTGLFFNQGDRSKNKVLNSASSLFSTAVISGSSSAPNLRDSIANNTTVSGKFLLFTITRL